MVTSIRFGTDGWRGIIADDFTFENVRLCSQAVADYIKARGMGDHGLVVGFDTRFASDAFAQAVAGVVAANGIKVYFCPQPTPTPVVSYAISTLGAAGAVIITASHNPASWNGFKYKPEYAGSASPEVVAALEVGIAALQEAGASPQGLGITEARAQGLLQEVDPVPAYLRRLGELVDLEGLRQAGLRVAVDAMYGAGAGFFPRLMGGGKTEVIEIHAERNPLFPGLHNPEPIARNLDALGEVVRHQSASVGIATDGDADRLGIVDEKGAFVNQLQVFALLILYLLEVRGLRGPIVKSLTTTSMALRLGELYGVPVLETPVGFKYIGPKMMEHQALVGGEESGGYGFRGHIPERDGILAGLYFLDLMVQLRKSPSQLIAHLFEQVGPHYYDRWDLGFDPQEREHIIAYVQAQRPTAIAGVPVVEISAQDGFRFLLQDGSWLLIRFSGTEPLLRIYTETDSPERVQRLLQFGKGLVPLP